MSLSAPIRARHTPGRFDLVETTIPAIQDAIEDRVITAEQLVRMYLKRIAAYDGKTTAAHLNAYIHLNRHALDDADERDDETTATDHGRRDGRCAASR